MASIQFRRLFARALRRPWAVLALAAGQAISGHCHAQDRGFQPAAVAGQAGTANGSYYALVIGIDKYPAPLPQLKTAVNDAKAVGSLLHDGYGFQVQLLLDRDATRFNILDALSKLRGKLNENDNLLIYYGGHGYYDHDADKAYWLPVDADSGLSPNTIMADDLTSAVKVLPSRHVLIISDSCYSGGLTRDVGEVPTAHASSPAYLNRKLGAPSRTLMASGGNEPVSDSGADGHSVFAYAVLHALDRAADPMFTARDIFYNSVEKQVAERSAQLPQYSAIRNSIRNPGAEDGDFVFTRKSAAAPAQIASANPAAALPPAPTLSPASGGTRTAEPMSNEPAMNSDMSVSEAYNRGIELGKANQYADEFPLMTTACNGGYAKGCTALGLMYKDGKGVNADSAQAAVFLHKACDWGEEQACTDLNGPQGKDAPLASPSSSKLDDLDMRISQMDSAAAGLNHSLNNMQKQMSGRGLALNGKWVELQADMNSSIGKAKDAVKNKDAEHAIRYAAMAESDIKQLKTFLGR